MHKTKITIRGIVQNVGLRAQIKVIADRLGVCGTVENTIDGSVLVVCEAERTDIEEMVRQIRSGARLVVIEDILVEEGPPATGMEGFEIMRGDFAEELLYAWSSRARAMVAALNVMRQGRVWTNETLARMERGKAGEGPEQAGEGPSPDQRDPGQDGTGPGRSEAGPGRDEGCDKIHGQQAGRVTGERCPEP